MVETTYDILPFPYSELAQPLPVDSLDTACLMDDSIETSAALAGMVAAASRDREVEAEDIRLTLRLLAEPLHATEAL